LQAGIYLLFYTLAASLPLLLVIFYLNVEYKSLHFLIMDIPLSSVNYWVYFGIVGAFLVKIPIFMVHL
jgi:NADH-ubiquinone oxidoreductase chain 4